MTSELLLILPEILITLTLVGVLFSEVSHQSERVRLILPTALAGLGASVVQSLLLIPAIPARVFGGSFVVDGMTLFFRIFAILLAVGTFLCARFSTEIEAHRRAEFAVLVLAATLAISIGAGSTNLMLAFLAMQVLSISLQILAGFSKRSPASSEAAIKMMVVSATSLALFLGGALLLFAKTGSLNVNEIRAGLAASGVGVQTGLAIFSLLFFGLSFWIGAFPVQLWAPDVLEGAPTAVSGLVAMASRGMGLGIAARIVLGIFAVPSTDAGEMSWQPSFGIPVSELLAVLAGVSCLLPSILLIGQNRIKRLVAGILTVEAGFALIGILVMEEAGLVASLFSLLVQVFAAVGAFSLVAWAQERHGVYKMGRIVLGRPLPVLEVLALVVFLLGMIGMPPLPGFLAKFALVGVAVEKEWYGLAAVTVASGALQIVAGLQLAYGMVSALVQNGPSMSGLGLQGVAGAVAPLESGLTASKSASLPGEPWWLAILYFLVPLFLLSVFSEATISWLQDAVRSTLW